MNTAILLLALFGAAPVAVAAEAERARGEALALACAVCHGTAGRSPGAIPAIHGKPARAIVRALKDFRDGRKPATVMGRIATGYSDRDIEDLAAYLAGLK